MGWIEVSRWWWTIVGVVVRGAVCRWREMRKIGMDEVLNLNNLTGAPSICLLRPDPRHFMSFFSTHKCQPLPGIY